MPLTTTQLEHARRNLADFQLKKLFLEDLGWMAYKNPSTDLTLKDGTAFVLDTVAQVSGVVVLEVRAKNGTLPDSKQRREVHTSIAKKHHENLLVFTDRKAQGDVTSSIWSWAKKEGTKRIPRELYYLRGQSGDLLLSKLHGMIIDMSELDDEGRIPVPEVTRRLAESFDIERVTKKFFGEFQSLHGEFVELIEGIDDPADRKWYASVLLNRLMFVYFMQKKGFVDANPDYLWDKFQESRKHDGKDKFYSKFLDMLFFEGFAKDESKRSADAKKRLGKIRYLNGGLFLHHPLEIKYKGKIKIPDQAFANLLSADEPKGLFERFTWALDDRPGGDDRTINPDVLGYIFEKYINQKAFGAYYTRPEITDYLCERTISQLVLERLNKKLDKGFVSLNDALVSMDKMVVRALLLDGSEDGTKGILYDLSILDPACGSGAFILAAMKRLFEIHVALVEKIKYLHDADLTALDHELSGHASREYGIKKRLITDNLYGVDLMDEAVEICRLRLFLALVSSVYKVEHLEPLPNIDFNIMPGNSLVGLMKVDSSKQTVFGARGQEDYARWLDEKNTLVDQVRHLNPAKHDIEFLRNDVAAKLDGLRGKLNDILLTEFTDELEIHFDEFQPDGEVVQRELTRSDIHDMKPFHWGFEFDEIVISQGGFDIIITNPPWEAFKPGAKEFFSDYSDVVTKNKMDIKVFDKEQDRLLALPGVADAWAEYQSRFPHLNRYFRTSPDYANQDPIIDGKKKGTDLNLFKLFTERTVHLLRKGGLCGIVLPSGIYTDLGCKQLRELLFAKTEVTGLFGFENRKAIFEGVHRSFKFVVLTFEKGRKTTEFPAVFMRHDVGELESFPRQGGLTLDTKLIRELSPDSLSIMEFHSETDVTVVKKMLKHPKLGHDSAGKWVLRLSREFHMTDDKALYHKDRKSGMIPLVEGKCFHQFDHRFDEPKYWLHEKDARASLSLSRRKRMKKVGVAEDEIERLDDTSILLDYQVPRLAFRDIARNTDERTMISTVLPPRVFCPHTVSLPIVHEDRLEGRRLKVNMRLISSAQMLFLCGVFNSFTFDSFLRRSITTHLSFYYLYEAPVPRLTDGDEWFSGIVERAARLICTTPEYDDLAKEVGLGSHKRGATEFAERARLRAELDGIVAHLYGLTEEEFVHILSTFPLVADPIKLAAHNAYRDVERGVIKS